MINPRSLRFRLAIWYFCTVAAICLLAGFGYWLTVRTALNHAMDQNLRYRLIGLHQFIEALDHGGNELIASSLKAISPLGELCQVFDDHNVLIAQSFGLERHHVPSQPPPDLVWRFRTVPDCVG